QRGTAGLNFDLERWQTDLPDRFNYVADRDFFCRVFRVRIKVNIGAVLNRSITLLICLLKASFSTSTRRVLAACRRLFIFGGLKPDTRRSIYWINVNVGYRFKTRQSDCRQGEEPDKGRFHEFSSRSISKTTES